MRETDIGEVGLIELGFKKWLEYMLNEEKIHQ